MIVRGADTEDQDNVCSSPTLCIDNLEYEVSALKSPRDAIGTNRVCSSYKVCDSTKQYLYMFGNKTSDNVCLEKTDCSLGNEVKISIQNYAIKSSAYALLRLLGILIVF
jgi:hypothetical protein